MEAGRARPVLDLGEVMSRGWVAIVNPEAGGRRRTAAETTAALRGHADCIHVTDRRGHAADIAAASRHSDGFVVAGGDGTIFEVLQHMDLPRQRLLILPTGRGNSLARDLGTHGRAVDLM
jgi:diacylglycerol kinase family enzyme